MSESERFFLRAILQVDYADQAFVSTKKIVHARATTFGVAEEEFSKVTLSTFHSPNNALMVWVVRPRRFERLTFCSSGKRSIYRLSCVLDQFKPAGQPGRSKRGPKFGVLDPGWTQKRMTATGQDLVTL